MEIFNAGEQDTGEQQEQSQLGPGVSQQIHRDGVAEEDYRPGCREEKKEEQKQAPAQDCAHGPLISPGGIFRREVGHRRGEPHGGEGEHYGTDRQEKLIEPHDLGPHQPGEKKYGR